ncbi:MAG: type I-E CRISPR-associated protein Cas6/Cse3/CasE [Oscillospiraceae bacterium]|nr:type I-E CRISPR-associated protein Cas6/Cse3/CasE [Oscillospiraceae bacterium]
MYLSRVLLDVQRRDTMRALASPSRSHGALDQCFPGGRPKLLWRLDRLRGQLYLLLLSETRPDLTTFCAQFSPNDSAWETKDYESLLSRIEGGSRWRFRLTANPTVSARSDEAGKRGRIHAHITTASQKQWLLDRAEKHGSRLAEDAFDVTEIRWERFYKKEKRPVTLLSVSYEGVLEVTDPALFRDLLVNGIGRAKAYGMGMLTVMRG